MKFIDEAKIYVKAGDGGRGCVSFRREKYVPKGGPDGGDGGDGGDVVVTAAAGCRTLLDLKFHQHHVAKRGGHGSGNNRRGRDAGDVVVTVPIGTVITDAETGEVLGDLTKDGERVVVARGGIGGKGNAFFATATNQAPRFAQEGTTGEERWLNLELKLLADVGIIGLPNAGKSTLISRISAARPKIADYPFTTLVPNLGVVKYGNAEPFVVADIPGLVEGAHRGTGLGMRFLRHIERTSVLVHLIDLSRQDEGDARKDYEVIRRELGRFSDNLIQKPEVVAFNKVDVPAARERVKKEIDRFREKGIETFAVSAATGEGLETLLQAIIKILRRSN
ncbi:MAG TPA: GTPase ObgE [Syntrophales bacterium]|nr:GTPase ObgE [Syntrophobacterales bacterium]HRR39696.1 GTPase ObgE [Syntrophales bacterium]HRT27782.1 GTPase ObgE [Syntrophales bacterium]